MPANIFGRYVWLVDILRHYKHLSYKEINEKWKYSGLDYGEEGDIPLRTFHNHRKAIQEIFNIKIALDDNVRGYKYHIEDPEELEGDAFRSWLIDSYATLNQVQADQSLRNRVEFEDIPSGHTWLSLFMRAMRENKVMKITHKGFDRMYENTFEIHPYSLKVANRRWYIIAFNPYYADWNERHKSEADFLPKKEIRVYALDRILDAHVLDATFTIQEGFSTKKFYEGCTGSIPSDGDIETVKVKAYGRGPDYLRTLPLHRSQKELESGEGYAIFSYEVKITYDFIQLIMQQGDQVEVLEPKELREHMKALANTLKSYYNS